MKGPYRDIYTDVIKKGHKIKLLKNIKWVVTSKNNEKLKWYWDGKFPYWCWLPDE